MSEYDKFKGPAPDAELAAKVAAMLKQYGKPVEPKREVLRLTKREQELNKKL
jgi:hypothetical protein